MNFFAHKNIILILGDLIIAAIAVYGGVYLRFFPIDAYDGILMVQPILPKAIAFSVIIIFTSFLVDLYDNERRKGRKEIISKVILSGILASFSLAACYYIIPSLLLGRGIFLFSVSLTILLQSIWHFTYDLFMKLPGNAKRVLILGTGPIAKIMGNVLYSNNNGFALSGYVNCMGEAVHVPMHSVVGNGDGILAIALKEKVQKIVVSLSERRGTFPVREVLNCKLNGIDVIDGPFFYEQMTGKLLIENLNPSHLIFSDGFRITVFRRYIKRALDVCLAFAGIFFALPFLVIIPVLIRISSRGPVFFKQMRVGEGEKNFTVLKFRTMVEGAEKDSGPVWSQSGDNRITRLGRILRKSRLDELPQLFNVIRGDMSFIGPRPERPFFVDSLKKQIPFYSERHCIKPGVTGWAQVKYEYGDSIEDAIEKLRYDMYYIKYQSISLDLLIVLDTAKVILFGRGGR
jgi:sugar transferase (PEP-CTERM system associated)